MIRRIALLVFIFLFVLPCAGCWNYRGLNELSIVSGIAIDKDPESGNYLLSFEVIDLTKSPKDGSLSTILLESEGKTLFDAARNAKKRVVNKLYFGHMQIAVISEEVARNEKIAGLISWFLSDAECRETMCIIVSREKTAKDLLKITGIGHPIVAYEIHQIIKEDHDVTSSTANIDLYNVYNTLMAPGFDLTLAAFHNVINDEEPATEADGIAVFKGERLAGFLSPEESKSFLFAVNQVMGGVLTFSAASQGKDDISLEILDNRTKRSFTYEDGRLRFLVETETNVFLNESFIDMNALDLNTIEYLEQAAQAKLENDILSLIHKVQAEYGSDIFGFGNLIYRQSPGLWEQLANGWDAQFKTLDVQVNCKIHIVNSASTKE